MPGCASLGGMHILFDPIRIGDIDLATRIVMAPLTRNRASPGQVPNALMAEYYAQRADPATGAGLIVSEASQISPQGRGYVDTPGIHNNEQVQGWRLVTDAVHARGGRIVLQMWHVGRVSHFSLQPGGGAPVSSSTRVAQSRSLTASGPQPCSPPRALATAELPGIVEDYRLAAGRAMDAGFDGVEVHGANGYLLEQFLRDTVNDRSDAYGGPIENRARLLLEVVRAVAAEAGAGRTGLRVSPALPLADAGPDSQTQALYAHVVDELVALRLAYLHMIEGQTGGARETIDFDYEALRRAFTAAPGSAWMVNNGYTRTMALDTVARGKADLVAFGKPFIANPDLGRRLREDAALNVPDSRSFYTPGAVGYTDYRALADATA